MAVYFILAAESRRVKIGHGANPARRLASLQTGCPEDLTLAAIMPGGETEEASLHARFSRDRIRGEWFRLSPEISALIAEHRHESVARIPEPIAPAKRDVTMAWVIYRIRRFAYDHRIAPSALAGMAGLAPNSLRNMHRDWNPTLRVIQAIERLIRKAA